MSGAKSYDGMHPVLHVVQRGESLSSIAEQYRLPDWHAIWLYNTEVRKVYLGNDPDVIRSGEQLFIPRLPKGYDRLIKRLEILKLEMVSAGDREMYSLEAQKWEYKEFAAKLDFAGDALTVAATFGLKLASTARAAKVAETTTGRGKAAAQYLANKETEKLAQWLDKTFKDEATKAVATKVDEYHGQWAGKDTSVATTTHKTVTTRRKVVDSIRGFSLIGGKVLLDSADIALSFLTPTKLANAWLWLHTGETVEGSRGRAERYVKAAIQNASKQLDEKIGRIAAERHIVYPPGGSTIGKYMNFPPLHISVPPVRAIKR